MSLHFKNSRSRLDRAEYHAKAFHSQWQSMLVDESFSPVGRYDKSSGWYIVSAFPSDSTLEKIKTNTLALELGEMAYQLRSALDGLIWEAVTLSQGTEPAPDSDGVNRLEFPILSGKNADFNKCALHKFPFPDQLKTWLSSIQPYSPVKPVGDSDRGLNTTLEDIHDLARHDRHRRLRVVAAFPSEISFMVEATSDPTSRHGSYEAIDTCDFLSGRYEFLRFQLLTDSGIFPDKIRLNMNVKIEIFVEHIELYGGENLGVQLQRFIQAVDLVISRFEQALA